MPPCCHDRLSRCEPIPAGSWRYGTYSVEDNISAGLTTPLVHVFLSTCADTRSIKKRPAGATKEMDMLNCYPQLYDGIAN